MRRFQVSRWTTFILWVVLAFLSGCSSDEPELLDEETIRGLKGYRITEMASYELRRFSSLVRPLEESELSFEISGQLKAINLEIGQKVARGDLIAEIDPASLKLKVEQSRASLAQTQSALDQARSDYQRRASLLPKGYVTEAEYDIAKSTLDSAIAQRRQAQQQLAINEDNLGSSRLISPFDGTLSNVYVENFEQISAGEPIASLFSEVGYEALINVPAAVIGDLQLADEALIRFPDISDGTYPGVVTELGMRAEIGTTFPVVIAILNAPDTLHAGMSADVEIKIHLQKGLEGYLLPISCFDFAYRESLEKQSGVTIEQQATVYLYNPETSSVHTTEVTLSGVLGSRAIVSDGLEEGQIVASAGVTFLYEGQRVKLLPMDE